MAQEGLLYDSPPLVVVCMDAAVEDVSKNAVPENVQGQEVLSL